MTEKSFADKGMKSNMLWERVEGTPDFRSGVFVLDENEK